MTLPSTRPLLYLITEGWLDPTNFTAKKTDVLNVVREAAAAGVHLVQIREKKLEGRALFELVREAVAAAAGTATRIMVNDRIDVALAAEAHGVHLPAAALSVAVIRKHAPPAFLIGVSTHTSAGVCRAVNDGADFATCGPIFQSPGKGAPIGITELRKVCGDFADFPILALGGVDEANFKAVIDAGAAGIAAIRLFNDLTRLALIVERVKSRTFG